MEQIAIPSAGPELDARVAELMGWSVQTAQRIQEVFVWPNDGRTTYLEKGDKMVVHASGVALTVPPYSTDKDAAASALRKAITSELRPAFAEALVELVPLFSDESPQENAVRLLDWLQDPRNICAAILKAHEGVTTNLG